MSRFHITLNVPITVQVKGGRWGGINIPKVDQSNGEPLGDVYGRLRSPWTANERP